MSEDPTAWNWMRGSADSWLYQHKQSGLDFRTHTPCICKGFDAEDHEATFFTYPWWMRQIFAFRFRRMRKRLNKYLIKKARKEEYSHIMSKVLGNK